MRVLYAPRNIADQPVEWAAALVPFGVQAEVWSFGEPAFGMAVDRVFDADRLLADPGYRWQALTDAVAGFDVFHFQYGRSLLNARDPALPQLWDLPLLRSLGKRIFMHWHGSDVRLRSIHMAREPQSYLANVEVDEAAILARIAIARSYCDRMFVSTPGLLDYVPDAVHLPLALDVSAWRARRDGPEPAVPVVVHIPSRRSTKDSDLVDAALYPLAQRGVIFYRSPSGLSRSQVKAELARADLVMDSLTMGDHGLISLEAMASGAIALAHVHERNRARMPGDPVVEVTGDTLAEVVTTLAEDPAERARLRRLGQHWVRTHHDRPVVGRLLAEAYRSTPTKVVTGYPEWPRSAGQIQLKKLEKEVQRLRGHLARATGDHDAPPLTWRDRVERHPHWHLAIRRLATSARRLRLGQR
jgi:glycosyl transferase family 1